MICHIICALAQNLSEHRLIKPYSFFHGGFSKNSSLYWLCKQVFVCSSAFQTEIHFVKRFTILFKRKCRWWPVFFSSIHETVPYSSRFSTTIIDIEGDIRKRMFTCRIEVYPASKRLSLYAFFFVDERLFHPPRPPPPRLSLLPLIWDHWAHNGLCRWRFRPRQYRWMKWLGIFSAGLRVSSSGG